MLLKEGIWVLVATFDFDILLCFPKVITSICPTVVGHTPNKRLGKRQIILLLVSFGFRCMYFI
jgi:hypothetical protein